MNKGKIALLNMRYDNNYGGNLQRYAMVTVLQRMGYSVEYLYIRDNWDDWFNRSVSKICKQSVKQFARHIKHPKTEPWLAWHREPDCYCEECGVTDLFLNKYIPHTKQIYSHRELEKVFKKGDYDAILAGSDQIWRKKYVERYGLGTWFFDFIPIGFRGKKVVYGASFGVSEQEYTREEQDEIRPLFNSIDAVSVRETSGLDILDWYGWKDPQAEVVLDPTLLLTKKDYSTLIDYAETKESEGDMFCYVLDVTKEIENKIRKISEEKGLTPYLISLKNNQPVSIEQWLRNIRDAKYVFTDSYHGLLFSIIFGKPFHLENNSNRGNARFDSILDLLHIDIDNTNYEDVYDQVDKQKQRSIEFITQALR